MTKNLVALLALTAIVNSPVWAADVNPIPTPPPSELQYFLGTWNCVTTGATSFTETETDVMAPGDHWIHGSGPTTVTGGASGREDFYLGYDAQRRRWVLVSIASNGNYSVATSSSPDIDRSTWQSSYPVVGGNGTFTENSPTQYTIDNSYTYAGRTLTTHAVCNKQ